MCGVDGGIDDGGVVVVMDRCDGVHGGVDDSGVLVVMAVDRCGVVVLMVATCHSFYV